MFWSLNEKTAYRRNRVVQTRLNMVMDDLSTQRESSRRTIRYEAHKFRQKSGRYYSHPLSAAGESAANIAPPNWRHPDLENADTPAKKPTKKSIGSDSDESDDGGKEDDDDSDVKDYQRGRGNSKGFSPRKSGIITRAKKPAVKFSMYKEVHAIENDSKVNSNETQDDSNLSTPSPPALRNHQFRSQSALQCRDIPDLPGQSLRQQSALPLLRSADTDQVNCPSSGSKSPRDHEQFQRVIQSLRSDTFFDKSKAAYQLRQDLKKRAKMRKQGVKSSVFTLQDALKMEREKYVKNSGKVTDYIKRIEAAKVAESLIVNKWTRNEFESQLNL